MAHPSPSSDYFGYAAAVSGDVVVVGDPGATVGGSSGGAAHVFVKPGGGWAGTLIPTATLTAADEAKGDSFGYSVAFSGKEIVVGAVAVDLGATYDAGAAYLFRNSAATSACYLPLVVRRQ